MISKLAPLILFSFLVSLSCSNNQSPTQSDMLFTDPPGVLNIQVTKAVVTGRAYPATVLTFNLPIREQVSLKVLNATGFQVRELVNKMFVPGTHSVEWDLKNDDGNMISNGIYIFYLRTRSFEDWKAVAMCMENCENFYDN